MLTSLTGATPVVSRQKPPVNSRLLKKIIREVLFSSNPFPCIKVAKNESVPHIGSHMQPLALPNDAGDITGINRDTHRPPIVSVFVHPE
ncbi:MAG TPA: hypothetical protein PKX84_05575 [Bacteroidia bacterium]|nr:hypothetical protein [Bacteroidia bacterium]